MMTVLVVLAGPAAAYVVAVLASAIVYDRRPGAVQIGVAFPARQPTAAWWFAGAGDGDRPR
jgi:hypothetical protein